MINNTNTNNNNNNNILEATSVAADLKLRRLTLFSSGVGFYQHSGDLTGNVEFILPYAEGVVDDALKSIVITDPDASPTVTYHSEDTLERTMSGLSIDLHGNNHLAELLNSLKGAEIEILASNPIRGRIMLVEHRRTSDSIEDLSDVFQGDSFLTLFTSDGIKIIPLKEIRDFKFCDPKINEDANRALDLILQSRDSDIRNLTVKLPGTHQRRVSLSYVIPTPIWKISYRLDLSQEKPFLQGWAIVDNDSDTDWDNVELALVTGKPVSFIQNLSEPYHLTRPTLPLAIAGMAEARTYDSADEYSNSSLRNIVNMPDSDDSMLAASVYDVDSLEEASTIKRQKKSKKFTGAKGYVEYEDCEDHEDESPEVFSISDGLIETASGRIAGDQFEFTIEKPVNLPRQQSAMLPLVESDVHAEKMLIFSAHKAKQGTQMNPAIGVELINNSGMKLPAGAITVYDGNTYAGDALIKFFPKEEKRIISYGEDLSVTGSFTILTGRETDAVSIKNGVVEFKRTYSDKRTYTFRNASGSSKRLIIEHPVRSEQATLITPSEYLEKTHNLYRFELDLPIGEMSFVVEEKELRIDSVTFAGFSGHFLLKIIENPDVTGAVREGFKEAIDLYNVIKEKEDQVETLEDRLEALLEDEERMRENLEAVGSKTRQGKIYMSRLASLDSKIDEVRKDMVFAEQDVKDAENAYEKYIQEMEH